MNIVKSRVKPHCTKFHMLSLTFYITCPNASPEKEVCNNKTWHTAHCERTRCLYQQRVRQSRAQMSAGQPHVCGATGHKAVLRLENKVVSKKLCQSEIKWSKDQGFRGWKSTNTNAARAWWYLVTGTAEAKLYTRQRFDRRERRSAQTLGRWEGRQQRNTTSAHAASLPLSKKHSTPVWINSAERRKQQGKHKHRILGI